MDKQLVQLCYDYLEQIESIRKYELMSVMQLVKEIGISFITLKRIQKKPETCSLITLRKLKKFVEAKNIDMSRVH